MLLYLMKQKKIPPISLNHSSLQKILAVYEGRRDGCDGCNDKNNVHLTVATDDFGADVAVSSLSVTPSDLHLSSCLSGSCSRIDIQAIFSSFGKIISLVKGSIF